MITISNDLSTESLLARRALAEKATPGPWFFTYNYTPIFDSSLWNRSTAPPPYRFSTVSLIMFVSLSYL